MKSLLRMGPTKGEYESAIRAKCSGCVKTSCPIHRLIPAAIGQQTDIMYETDFAAFAETVRRFANAMKEPFRWSALRAEVEKVRTPVHNNWWGIAGRLLKKDGFQCYQSDVGSTFKTRHGAKDRVWFRLVSVRR